VVNRRRRWWSRSSGFGSSIASGSGPLVDDFPALSVWSRRRRTADVRQSYPDAAAVVSARYACCRQPDAAVLVGAERRQSDVQRAWQHAVSSLCGSSLFSVPFRLAQHRRAQSCKSKQKTVSCLRIVPVLPSVLQRQNDKPLSKWRTALLGRGVKGPFC